MTLGQRIQELRKGLNLSQEELGEKMGVSRQAISKWEGDQTIPELDKLIALSKLFGLTVGQLLGVEQPVPATAAHSGTPRRMKLLLAGMGAAILVLAILVGTLWSQVRVLEQQTALNEDYVLCYDRELFQIAECTLSDMDYGSPWYEGDQDLTLEFTLRPVKQFKDWEVIGYTARIQGRAAPWWLGEGQPGDGDPPPRVEDLTADPKTGRASLTLSGYQGESLTVLPVLREKDTGRALAILDAVFTITPEIHYPSLNLTSIQVETNPAPGASIPKSIALALPDPRFDS